MPIPQLTDTKREERSEGFYKDEAGAIVYVRLVEYPDGRVEEFHQAAPDGTTYDEASGTLTVPGEDGETGTIEFGPPSGS
ncbi:hypothetical protein AB0I10_18370 [Streptomyces sp. NPDC050636]|uniref:hypothetical protein n=1 Tax=Streptomyces sp. NPDC050636 TaxID=3154510 RepID=UPI00344060E4